MFDIAPTELLLVAVVALVVIGPKDLPRAMRFVGQWVAKARGVARHFRSGIDEMIRQSELEDMEKKWAEENARIMRDHPAQQVIEGEMVPLGGPPVHMEPIEPHDVPAIQKPADSETGLAEKS
jgi:sec-independent protein translocase protein TatB